MSAAESYAPVDRAAVMVALGGDEALFADAVTIFLEDCPGRLTNIRSALDDGDPRAIRASAHALKGAASILAARDLFDAARTIEELGDAGRIVDARQAWSRLSDAAAAVTGALATLDRTPKRPSRTESTPACYDTAMSDVVRESAHVEQL